MCVLQKQKNGEANWTDIQVKLNSSKSNKTNLLDVRLNRRVFLY